MRFQVEHLLPVVHGMLRLALRNLIRHRRQSLFGLAVLVLGVGGLVFARGFVLDVYHQLGEMTIRSQLGHIQVAKAGFREGGAGRADEYLLVDAPDLMETIRGDARVVQVMGRLTFSGVLGADAEDVVIEGEGVDPAAEARLGAYTTLIAGEPLRSGDEASVVVGEGVAKRLRAQVGDWLHVTASTVDGSVNVLELRVAGIFRSFSKEYDERAVRLPLVTAQDLLQTSGVTLLVVQLRETDDTAAVVDALRAHWVGRSLDVEPWYRISDFYASTRLLYERQFGMLQFIAVVLIAMSVFGSFNTSVLERTAEFGTMRALGNRRRLVLGSILVEAFLLGLAGCALALVLSSGAAIVVSWIGIPMPPPPNAESGYTARILLSGRAMTVAGAIGIAAAVVGALLPAIRVTRMPLIVALGRGT